MRMFRNGRGSGDSVDIDWKEAYLQAVLRAASAEKNACDAEGELWALQREHSYTVADLEKAYLEGEALRDLLHETQEDLNEALNIIIDMKVAPVKVDLPEALDLAEAQLESILAAGPPPETYEVEFIEMPFDEGDLDYPIATPNPLTDDDPVISPFGMYPPGSKAEQYKDDPYYQADVRDGARCILGVPGCNCLDRVPV